MSTRASDIAKGRRIVVTLEVDVKLSEQREHGNFFQRVADASIEIVDAHLRVRREEPHGGRASTIRIRLIDAPFVLVLPAQLKVQPLQRLVVRKQKRSMAAAVSIPGERMVDEV